MPLIDRKDVQHMLAQTDAPAIRPMAEDIGLIVALTKVLNASLALGNTQLKSKLDYALALGGKGLAQSELMQSTTGSGAWQAVNVTVATALSNKALFALSSVSPARAASTVALVTFEKLFLVGGLSEAHKCKIAVGALATTTGLTILSAPTGVGLVVGVIGVLAAGADALNKCQMP